MQPSRTSFFNNMKESYGKQILLAARYYLKTSTKIARLQQHTAFNRRCRHYRLLPRCLRVKLLVRTAEGYKIAGSASPKFLAARIQDCYYKTRQLEHDLFFQKRQLEFALQPEHFQVLEQFRLSQSQFETDTARDRQKCKFDALLDKRSKSHPTPSDQWVVNLSTKVLTQPQTSVLAKGLNFALPPPPKQILTAEIVTCTKAALRRAGASQGTNDRART